MSYMTQLPEPAAFAVHSLTPKSKGDTFPCFYGGGVEFENGYAATDEGSPATTAEVTDEKHSSSASSDDKKEDEKWIWVLDPMTRKLRVPMHLLVPTHATSTPGTVPSLCIAFLEGRCRHAWCRQAHVVPAAIPQLRYEALSAPTCCRFHQDPQETTMLTSHFKYILITGNGGSNELIPTDRVACTVGLRRYLVHNVPKKSAGGATGRRAEPGENDVLELPAKFICRLHLAHRCRYLDDCNNIHICREFEVRLQPPPQLLSSLNSVTTSTRTVNIGDTCYTVTPLAVGDVSDEDFNAIAEAQRINHRNASTPASMTFRTVTPSCEAGALCGGETTGCALPYHAAGSLFPAFPDYRSALRTPNSSIVTPPTGHSPGFPHIESPSQLPQGVPGAFGGQLRIYDVRPKGQAETAPSSCASSPVMHPAGPEKSGAAALKAAPPRYVDSAAPMTLAARPNGGSGSGCVSSSTDGGVSAATSGANTPLASGAYGAVPTRTAVAARK